MGAVRSVEGDGARDLGPARSGRLFVIGAIVALVLIWAALFVAFRQWRSGRNALAAYGAREVAPLVDPLADRGPGDIHPKVWRRAVEDTHAMLVAATASGTIDRVEMERLRAELAARVARDTPATVREDLMRLWDEMEDRVGPILQGRTSRPPHSPMRPAVLKRPKRKV